MSGDRFDELWRDSVENWIRELPDEQWRDLCTRARTEPRLDAKLCDDRGH